MRPPSAPSQENPFLSGNFAPVHEETTAFDLAVTGHIPESLTGRFLRIGPNPVSPRNPATYHWFTGNGMVHGVRLRDGKAEWYRSRFVADDGVTATLGRPRTPGPRHGMGEGIVNTNVIGHAGRTWALVEGGGLPMELTDELETVCTSTFGDTLPGSFTAHPKRDPVSGELFAIVYFWEWQYLQLVVLGVDGRVRRTVNIPVDGKPMTHDCAITESQVLVFDLPVTFDLDLAIGGASMPYVWNPRYGCRVGLLPREATSADGIRWCSTDPCYVFHPLNAYDLPDGRVVCDLVKHPRMFARDLRGPNEDTPVLCRWTLDPATGRIDEQPLFDRGLEFPRHDERRLGRTHRYGYTAAFGPEAAHGPAFRHDLVTGTTQVHDYGAGRVTLEPVFVPAHADSAEDDGWVMSYVYDATTNRSDVVILHSQDFAGEPVATIHLPQRVPFGFHGNWVPDPA